MPDLIRPLSPQGAVLDILLALSAGEVKRLRHALQPIPQSLAMQALVDTGASHTSVDSHAFQSFGLPAMKVILVSTASTGSTPLPREQYEVSLTILHPTGDPRLHIVLDPLIVTHADLLPAQIPALIGCDLLNRWVFNYDGPRQQFRLTY
ncbi:hypothetical protein AYO44_11895 [Planctomycetaceae bacterium SCGC AG-212-F19]|nr:hypothetical protein AYO44_11895 [Planctomycetaceae bacterium SCGC AG-212-F19]